MHREFLHWEVFTQRIFYTEKSLDRRFLHREVFTERNFYTQKLLCREVSARGGFTHRSEACTHRGCNIGEFIHREACAHRSLATEELCDVAKTQFYPRFWGLTFISCQRVAREISKSQLYDSFYRSNLRFVRKACIWSFKLTCSPVDATIGLHIQLLFSERNFYAEELLDTDAFAQRSLLHRGTPTHRSFYTQKFLHREAFTQRSFHTQTRLHRRSCTRRSLHTEVRKNFCTQEFLLREVSLFTEKLLHIEVFTQRSQRLYMQKFLHRESFTHRCVYIEKSLHRGTCTYRSFYTDKSFTQRSFYTQTRLHTEPFTQRNVYSQMPLHRDVFTQRSF